MDSIYYHFAILTLLWPLLAMEQVGPQLSPRHICYEAADAIQQLVKTFSQLYTLRRIPAFASHILSTACIALITMARSHTGPRRASALELDATAICESLPSGISNAIASLTEIAASQRGAQRDLIRVQYLVHVI